MVNISKLKVLSLFSGIGAFEKALEMLGTPYELVGFSEIDKYAIESYCAIHNANKDSNLGDISLVENNKIPNSNLVVYGFPCQDISVAGHQRGILEGETRSGLLHEALRVIKHTKPNYAIAENVKNLIGKRHIEDFKLMLQELDDYGYNNYWKVLNAKDFGIPQNRERIFIVSIRKDIDNGDFEFPNPSSNESRLRSILLNDVEEKYYVDNDRAKKLLSTLEGYATPTSTPCEVKRLGGLYDSEGKRRQAGAVWDKNYIAPTIDTCQGGHREPLIIDDTRNLVRKLTPLECWRLMGFEDEDYWNARDRLEEVFYNGGDRSNSQMYKMAGNSICVNVLEGVFASLLL